MFPSRGQSPKSNHGYPPTPPPLPPPPPPPGQMSNYYRGGNQGRPPSSQNLMSEKSRRQNSEKDVHTNQSAKKQNSQELHGSQSRKLKVTDPNCPPLFYCGGRCADTPSYPRYPASPALTKRIPLGPSFGAVRSVPKGIGERCRRCGRPVFQAELQLGYHGAYHTECYKCCSCNKKLDSTTIAEHQGEIFCKGCYRRNFATSGVGFGLGAGTLQTP